MFSLELEFHDGVSPTEVIYVRRAQAVIGNAESAHVVIEGANQALDEIRVTRGVGRGFRCETVKRVGGAAPKAPVNCHSEIELDLGGVTARLVSLDVDLVLDQGESPDKAAVRVLRRALGAATPVFPAVAVLGASPIFTSFSQDGGILIGRSRGCALRLDAADISSEHARVGIDNGRFWVEDLGSTNGTFIGSLGGERVAGRRTLERGERICIGSEIIIAVLQSEQDVSGLDIQGYTERPAAKQAKSYPCVIATSDIIRPNRLTFDKVDRVVVGRDPASDIWVAAAHISRTHAEIALRPDGKVDIVDMSSNGTYRNGERLPKGIPISVEAGPVVLDLHSGLLLALCFQRSEEVAFLEGNIGESKTVLVNQTIVDEVKNPSSARDSGILKVDRDVRSTGSHSKLTPLEESKLQAPAELQQTQRFQVPGERPPARKDPRPSSKESFSALARPDDFATTEPAPRAPSDRRIIGGDSWGSSPRAAGGNISASQWASEESQENRSESEFTEPLLMYDPPSTGFPRWVFIVCCTLLVAILLAVIFADYGS